MPMKTLGVKNIQREEVLQVCSAQSSHKLRNAAWYCQARGQLAWVAIPHWLFLFRDIMMYPFIPQLVPQLKTIIRLIHFMKLIWVRGVLGYANAINMMWQIHSCIKTVYCTAQAKPFYLFLTSQQSFPLSVPQPTTRAPWSSLVELQSP